MNPNPMTPAPSASSWYWRAWLLAAAGCTIPWAVTWHALGVPGPIPLDHVLFPLFIAPELVAAFVNSRYTLSRYLWTLPWPARYAIGLWLGLLAYVTGHHWWGTVGALLGGLVFVWLSTPHMIAKRTVV